MNYAQIILSFSSLSFLNTAPQQSCIFNQKNLSELNNLSGSIVYDATTEKFPKLLFKAHEQEIYSFDEQSCTSVSVKRVFNQAEKRIYSVYYTNNDECDGGNSYGVIVAGVAPDPANSVAVIRDSAIECLIEK